MNKIVLFVIDYLLKLVDEELIKTALDKAFDVIEEAVADSSTHYDDAIILPIMEKLRALLSIPDVD